MTATRPLIVEDLYRFAVPGQPALAPDGGQVAYTLTTQDAEHDRPVSSLWLVPATGGPAAPRRLTHGPADSAPQWSPDGTALAFLRAGQLHLLPAGGGEARPLTYREHGAGLPVWSPDGGRIAFAAVVGRPGPAEPLVVDRLGKADGEGLLGPQRTHLFVVEVDSGRTTRVTGGDVRITGLPAWSPDGTRLAFPAAVGPDADLTGAVGAFLVGAEEEDAVPRPVGPAGGLIRTVDWYPAGDALLLAGRTTLATGHDALLRQPLDGSAPTALTTALDRNVMPGGPGYPGALPQFHGEKGGQIVFCARDRGATRLYGLGPGDGSGPGDGFGFGEIVELPLPPGSGVSGCSVAARAGAGGKAALAVADRSSFGEIDLLDLATGELTRLTAHMAQALPEVTLHPVTEREFTIADGTRVHGLITRDPQAPAPGPLLVDLHGGPHNAWAPHATPIHLYHQELVSRGWTVLTLNIRGSDGYGEDFFTAALDAWGESDEQDVLQPVAALVAEGLADPGRIGLTGYSYGGYLSCWLSARSDVFAAVVPGGLIADLPALAATSDEGHEIGHAEIADAARQRELSPLTHVDGVRAPTLILHGAADDTCPAGQAEQWFHALRTRGVPVRMVCYPGGSHLFILAGRPSHRVDYSRRLVDWVTEHTAR
ncbi:S9 family peptidase [Kitasatospora sp. NPDC092286]|uniref:S9 family peptidase n=1 Tax=Kitasatospora sp. NPDC092286 TaxID=3364087 RepID=UPI00382CCDE8